MKTITVTITKDQHELMKRRAFHEGLNLTDILRAGINAFIVGDLHVRSDGRYTVSPPPSAPPLIHVPQGADTLVVEPDWGPAVSGGSPYAEQAERRTKWGTRDLADYLRKETGRRFGLSLLRAMLKDLFGDTKEHNANWKFSGPDDPRVVDLLVFIEQGYYDIMLRESLADARRAWNKKKQQEAEVKQANAKSEEYRKRKAQEIKERIEHAED